MWKSSQLFLFGSHGAQVNHHLFPGQVNLVILDAAREDDGRGGEIRTHDLLYPKQARYQATLRPDSEQENVPGLQSICNSNLKKPEFWNNKMLE
jgi:hypothetical protein